MAYTLLLNKEYPSWLYPVTKGATTIWEHWDGIKPDGTFWDAKMNSFNHYAYGAVIDWVYTKMCGINCAEPGYKDIVIKPVINSRLKFARASVNSMYAKIESKWEYTDNKIKYTIQVPPNTAARFIYSTGEIKELGCGVNTLYERV